MGFLVDLWLGSFEWDHVIGIFWVGSVGLDLLGAQHSLGPSVSTSNDATKVKASWIFWVGSFGWHPLVGIFCVGYVGCSALS